jgi:hypothetical protein
MIIEPCDLEGDELQAAVDALIGNADLSPNEKHLLIEAAGHYVRRNPDAPTRDHPVGQLGFIEGDRWVGAPSLQTAIKRAFVLRGVPVSIGGATTQDGPGPFRPTK